MTVIASTCAYGGGGSYVTGFLGINLLVIALAFSVVAFIFMIGRLLPSQRYRSLSASALRVELVQLVISVVILAALLATSQLACSISSQMATGFAGGAAVPAGLSPFGFADYYIGNLALNKGIGLLTTIYSQGIAYSIDARVLYDLGTLFAEELPGITSIQTPVLNVTTTFGYDAGIFYGVLADQYFAVLAPLTTLTIGMLFLQYLALPIIQYTAFIVLLPVALVMRSLPFTGGGIRRASNAVLAIAIALYIIYPLTIAFDSYAVGWIFTTQNPEYGCTNCISSAYELPSISPSLFSTSPLSNTIKFGSFAVPLSVLSNFLGSSFGTYYPSLYPPFLLSFSQNMITEIGQFIFVAVVLFAVNISITMGFAMGLAKALDSGIEGASSFWSAL